MTGNSADIGKEAVLSVIGRAEKNEITLHPLEVLGLKTALNVLQSIPPPQRSADRGPPIKF